MRCGTLVGNVIYRLDSRHRRIVKRNLEFIHPAWSQNTVQETSKRVFQNMALTFLELCQMSCFSREDILSHVKIEGEKNLTEAMIGHKGLILITAHLGNWEMSAISAGCFLSKPIVAVARSLDSDILGKWLNRLRTRFGNIIIDKKGALPRMARTLREGGMLGILIDQSTTRAEGVETEFLGKTVTATPAAALLARRYNCPVVPAFCVREPDGSLTLKFEPMLHLVRTPDQRADLQGNIRLMTRSIEQAVSAYPEQWLWLHKRWKRHYPHLYPEDVARRNRRRKKRKAQAQATG